MEPWPTHVSIFLGFEYSLWQEVNNQWAQAVEELEAEKASWHPNPNLTPNANISTK